MRGTVAKRLRNEAAMATKTMPARKLMWKHGTRQKVEVGSTRAMYRSLKKDYKR